MVKAHHGLFWSVIAVRLVQIPYGQGHSNECRQSFSSNEAYAPELDSVLRGHLDPLRHGETRCATVQPPCVEAEMQTASIRAGMDRALWIESPGYGDVSMIQHQETAR